MAARLWLSMKNHKILDSVHQKFFDFDENFCASNGLLVLFHFFCGPAVDWFCTFFTWESFTVIGCLPLPELWYHFDSVSISPTWRCGKLCGTYQNCEITQPPPNSATLVCFFDLTSRINFWLHTIFGTRLRSKVFSLNRLWTLNWNFSSTLQEI